MDEIVNYNKILKSTERHFRLQTVLVSLFDFATNELQKQGYPVELSGEHGFKLPVSSDGELERQVFKLGCGCIKERTTDFRDKDTHEIIKLARVSQLA